MAMLSEATLRFGAAAARALLGVDALERRHHQDAGGLVVVNLDTDGMLHPEAFASWADARAAFRSLREESATLPEPDRRLYYRQLCDSTCAFIDWRDHGLPFEDQLARFLHVPAGPVSTVDLDAIRSALHDRLGAMGFHGDLHARCAAWEQRVRVPPDEVTDVLTTLLDAARDRTVEHVIDIPASKDDGMRVATVSGVPYNARCDYLRRTIELNIDPVLTLPGLRHLAVHEGCPGHYLQFTLRRTWASEGRAPADALLSVVNTASSSSFEGIADAGMRMISWDHEDDDVVQSLLNRHRAGIGTRAAWRLHALGWPAERVADTLRDDALTGGTGWVDNRVRFITEPARATLIWSYWWGERTVRPAWDAVPPGRRAGFVDYLYGRMHSNDTVTMFEA